MEGETVSHTSPQAPDGIHPINLEQQNPWIISQAYYYGTEVLAKYGWHVVISAIVFVAIWRKIEPYYAKWKARQEEEREAAEYHKNPDLLLSREQALQMSRMRMQEKYEEAAKENARKMKENEEQRRQQKIEEWDKLQKGQGYICRSKAVAVSEGIPSGTAPKKPKLRPEYNPLLGESGGVCGWRPARRGGAAGG